jgi:hypothetical protein
MMGVLTLPILEDLDMPDATFACPDLTTFCCLDELGLEAVGQRLEPELVRSWRAVSSSRTSGVAAAAAKAHLVTP